MEKQAFAGKSAAVIGLGVSGLSAARFLLESGAEVCGVDVNQALLESSEALGALQGIGLQTSLVLDAAQPWDFVVVSPGVPPSDPNYQLAVEAGIEIIGEIELACRHIGNPCVGVTGTNGKTTVVLLIGHVLNQAGMPARVLGNSGIPLTSEVLTLQDEIVVCELSSYQLETMSSRVLDVAVILNITPDHLDRYDSFEDYAAAKFRIQDCLKPGGKFYIEASTAQRFQAGAGGCVSKTYGPSLLSGHYRGRAAHEVENLMAAFAVCSEMGVSPEVFHQAVSTFEKPPHRIEFVREAGGVKFFDDSKGTNTDAVMRAVEAMDGAVVLIAGGLDKGVSFLPWLAAFGEKVKCICVIGQAKEKIKNELSSRLRIETCDTLREAVNLAFKMAEPGENVLLSPGCASFDMFRNYEHRGEAFKHLVQAL